MPRWDSLHASLTAPKGGDLVLLDWRWQITQTPTLERLVLPPPTGLQNPQKSIEDLDFAGYPTVRARGHEVGLASFSEVKGLWKPSEKGPAGSSTISKSSKEKGNPVRGLLFV